AGAALVIALDSGAEQAHRARVGAVGASGENAVVAAERADPVGAHRGVEAAVAELLAAPVHAQRVDHPVASAALQGSGGDAWAALDGGSAVGFNRHHGSPGPGRDALPCSAV